MILPIRRHIRMRSVQVQLANHLTVNPGQRLLNATTPTRRQMKATLHSRYERYISALLEDSDDDDIFGPTRSVSEDNYKSLLKQIHTNEVEVTIANFEDSAFLNARVPNIDKSEEKLPRTTRRTLSQLRCGYSVFLNSCQHRIDPSSSELCRLCDSTSHTTDPSMRPVF